MTLRMVVFDVDGTLVDSAGFIVRCLQSSFLENGCEEPQISAARKVIGLSLPEAVGKLDSRLSENVKEKIVQSYRKIFLENSISDQNFMSFFEGALPCIEALNDSGYLLGIATGKSRRGLDRLLNDANLSSVFVATGTADDGPSKPHPYMLNKVLADVGVAPDSAVMVGDTVFDIDMARSARTHAVGVSWGNHGVSELQAHGAHTIVDSFSQLTDWIHQNLPL